MKSFQNMIARCVLLVLCCKSIFAQLPPNARSANDLIKQQREEAERLWKQKDPRGIVALNKTLDYLNSSGIHDLAEGNFYLRKSVSDVHYDLARAYLLSGDKAAALSQLEQTVEAGGLGIDPESLAKETAFEVLKQEPRYQKVLLQLTTQRKLWSNTAFVTPYKQDLSAEEKIAGLSEFWSEVKFNFVNFDHVPELEWDATYRRYLSRILQTRTTAEYYRVLQEMSALLKDSHTTIDPPEPLFDEMYGRAPIWTGMVEGKVLVLKTDPTAEALGLRVGQEIFSIDDVPVQEYAASRIAPFASSSTPQDLELRTYTYQLLVGAKGKPVNITLRDVEGRVFKQTLPRAGWREAAVRAYDRRTQFKVLSGNIGYFAINDFNGKEINRALEGKFDAVAQTAALIIDLRLNGGGNGDVAYNILSTLTDKPFSIFQIRSQDYIGYFRSSDGYGPSWYTQDVVPGGLWQPSRSYLYTRPVVVLTSAATGSSAEDFVVAFDYMKRGKIIGEPTGGSSGQPFYFRLPGGGWGRVCTVRDRYPDGREFVGIGVQPDIVVRPTVAGIRAGKDEVLDEAVNYLSKQLGP